jgi:ATP-dependent RNA helicase MRH4
VGSENAPDITSVSTVETKRYKEFLLASETGSGKSIAYLLPMLQALKLSEARRLAAGDAEATPASKRGLNPRVLVLAPTHELAGQLTTAAKALLHTVKLRVLWIAVAKM